MMCIPIYNITLTIFCSRILLTFIVAASSILRLVCGVLQQPHCDTRLSTGSVLVDNEYKAMAMHFYHASDSSIFGIIRLA